LIWKVPGKLFDIELFPSVVNAVEISYLYSRYHAAHLFK